MGLVGGLLLVFLTFCLLMAGVLGFCLHERRKIDGLAQPRAQARAPAHEEVRVDSNGEGFTVSSTDEADDNRVALVLFGTIVIGALLALVTGYLVFIKTWA
jgi:hypothetical protein